MKALIFQKNGIVVKFSLKSRQVVNYNVPINLKFQYEYSKQIILTGNVVYPEVSFKPELIKIPKIPSGSKVHTPFRVSNQADVDTEVTFSMEEYPEFAIKTKQGLNITSEVLNLAPKERKELLLEFKPREPVAYCLYLPYILNGILGPPELNCPETLHSSYYLKQDKNRYKTSQEEIDSQKLPFLKILCAARKELLKFKSLVLNFNSFGKKKHLFQFTNVSGSCQEISMKISSIKSFTICPCSIEQNFCSENDTVTIIVDPEVTVKLPIEFSSEIQAGEFSEIVPIFVKSYSETDSFNYLKLVGHNPEPRISSNVKSLYFTPAPAGVKQSKRIVLELIAHQCSKTLEVTYKSLEIIITFVVKEDIDDIRSTVEYLVTFAASKDCSIETKVMFSCPCFHNITIEIFACSNTSTVINFMAEPSIVQDSTYPLFPAIDDKSSYADLLRTISSITERWLYTQGYFYQTYYRVPDDIARFPVDMVVPGDRRNFARKKKQQLLPLIQLLVNLMDSSIMTYIDDGQIIKEVGDNRSFASYIIYKNTISFLKSQDIFVPGLRPEHLLLYSEYLEVCELTKNSETRRVQEGFDASTFYRFSKQKWLDLFFHIYKVLVLQRIIDSKSLPQNNTDSEFIRQDRAEFENYLDKNRSRFPNWHLCDAQLLLWLEYHYNRQRTLLWPDQKFDGVVRLDDFSDVDDGVALATVLAAYCPYLADQLKDIYSSPKNVEQRVHNACRVVQSWKSLKLSFDCHPQTIVTANKIKIIFIVTYLYEVLPHFYPVNEVIIEAPLSESASYSLDIQNFGNVPIKYAATFFGEKSDLFQLDSHLLEIAGGKSRALKLTYMAKRVLHVSAILVLSGEVGGQRYAKSMAVTITGVPLTSSSDEIKLVVETYKLTNKRIPIKSPYGQCYKARIFFCFDEAKSFKDLHCGAALKRNHVPREVDIASDNCEFLEKGETIITLSTCFLHIGTSQFYLYFCNDQVGDFCVLIRTISALSKNRYVPIEVDEPPTNAKCTCKRGISPRCPKTLAVNLPSRNHLLSSSVDAMISKCLAESTFGFVERFCGTPIIFRLLKYYLDRFPQGFLLPSAIFNDQNEFNVNSTSKNITLGQKTIKINDVTSEETIPLVLHLDQNSKGRNVSLELVSTNGMEVRYYQLVFPKEEEEEPNELLL
ncbi:unnamed protein product [Ceutorhynchus assimilis]|uniref:Cilia- and flagella-associated protein 47 domain-containing protein n=1 Tax=Ceutorhynchus assimilis TaxID=467358 RepID=A0A9P0GT01_9CUCU|nr:unnamed protein product [Ceutorhynchus assimilis]